MDGTSPWDEGGALISIRHFGQGPLMPAIESGTLRLILHAGQLNVSVSAAWESMLQQVKVSDSTVI